MRCWICNRVLAKDQLEIGAETCRACEGVNLAEYPWGPDPYWAEATCYTCGEALTRFELSAGDGNCEACFARLEGL